MNLNHENIQKVIEHYARQSMLALDNPFLMIGSAVAARKLIEAVRFTMLNNATAGQAKGLNAADIDPKKILRVDYDTWIISIEEKRIYQQLGKIANYNHNKFASHAHYLGHQLQVQLNRLKKKWSADEQRAYDKANLLDHAYMNFLTALRDLSVTLKELSGLSFWNTITGENIQKLFSLSMITLSTEEKIKTQNQELFIKKLNESKDTGYVEYLSQSLCAIRKKFLQDHDNEFYESSSTAVNRIIAEMGGYWYLCTEKQYDLTHFLQRKEEAKQKNIGASSELQAYLDEIKKIKIYSAKEKLYARLAVYGHIEIIQIYGNSLEHFNPQFSVEETVEPWTEKADEHEKRVLEVSNSGTQMFNYIAKKPFSIEINTWIKAVRSNITNDIRNELQAEFVKRKNREIEDATNELRTNISHLKQEIENVNLSSQRKDDKISQLNRTISELNGQLVLLDQAKKADAAEIQKIADEYKNAFEHEHRKAKRLLSSLVAVIIGFCCYFGINAYINRIYFIKYSDYIWRNGIPEGIYEISEQEANVKAYYSFEVQNNRVLSVTLVDARGNIMDETLTGRKGRPARIVINYDDTLPERMTFFNAEDKFLLGVDLIHHRETNELQGIRIVDQKGIALQLPYSIMDINLNTWLGTDSSEITAKYSTISAFEILDMDDGLIKELSFGLDDYQKDGNGIYRMQFDHTSDGRFKEIRYIYENGDLEKVRYSYENARLCEKEYFAADNTTTRLVRYEYDDDSGKCLVTNTDEFDHLVNNQKGIAMLSYEYYSTGRIKYEIRCDSTGLPTADSDGVAIRYYSWDDDSGRIREIAYLDPYWSPIVKDYYARITYENRDDGRTIRWYDEKGPSYRDQNFVSKTESTVKDNNGMTLQTEAYYNIDNEIVMFNGAYMWRKTINQFGDIEVIEALDKQGNPMMSTFLDYATVKYQYDRHHQTKCIYIDSEGNEYAGKRNYSRVETKYTKSLSLLETRTYFNNDMVICREVFDYDKETGQIAQKEYLNGLDEPIEVGGFFKATVEYLDDENGTIVKRSYYGADGNLIMITPQDNLAYAISYIGYDRNGHIYLRESFDTQGNRVYDPEISCYKLVATTDERGNPQKTSYYDKDGESLLLRKEGYAVSEKTYNVNNQIISIITYDIDGKTPIVIDGYSKRENYYDSNTGKYLGTAFFDNNGNKTVAKSLGYWKVEYDYDKEGHIILECYYDALGSLTINENKGYAKVTASYDNKGRVIKCTYFGIDGPIVLSTEGAASIEVIYENDKKTITYLDENGETMFNALQGCAKMTIQYSQEGDIVSCSFFDQHNSPMISSVKGYSEMIKKIFKSEGKRIVEERYYDEYKNPIEISNSNTIGRRWLYNSDETIDSFTNILVISEYRDTAINHTIDNDYKRVYEKWETFNQDNFLVCIEYYDNQGNPWNYFGWSRCELDYNNQGLISEKRYYDLNNRLTKPDNDVSAMIKYSYEENGRIRYEYYFDESGNHIKNFPSGEYGKQYEYNQEGKNISIGFLDSEGKLIDYHLDEYAYGYSACLFGYDDQGKYNSITLCDENFEPFVSLYEGYCTSIWTFDENGQITSYEYLDADGNLMFNNREGYARKQITYDKEGNQLSIYCYNLDGTLIE